MFVTFPPFHADLVDERLWRGTESLHVTRKAWEVLRVLLEANGRLVTKDQLAHTVWNGTHVGDDSLTKVVRELRRALGDDQRAPRFIATVHGRGYRFVAPIGNSSHGSIASPAAAIRAAPALIGRERQLSTLASWLEDARRGQRHVAFISGDVGIGKSSLVTAFIAAAPETESSPVRIAAGQCVEQFGEADPFLPVIAALQRLSRTATAAAIVRRAAAQAPWIAVACGLAPHSGTAGGGATRAGVLRTLADVIEAIASDAPLVLVLEDLHWSDPSTLDLVNLLARRTDPARLLVVCTLRHTDALAAGHPSALLLRELRRTDACREIVLDGLARADVEGYLRARLAGGDPPLEAADYLLRHTGGNPFFMGALVDDLLARGALQRAGDRWELHADETPAIPSGSLAALAPRLERLSDSERAMLAGASVVGDDFSAETVAAVLGAESLTGVSLEEVEVVCERLVQHQDILCRGEGRSPYRFRHALYRQAFYEGIVPARRRRMHGHVADAQAAARPPASLEGAAELAEHCARAGDDVRAASYHLEASEAARARFADPEVASHLGAALMHLRRAPQTPERQLQELVLIHQHAAAMLAANGFGDTKVADAFRRAQSVARQLEIPLAHFAATAGLLFFHLMRAELSAAAALAAEMTTAAPHLPLPECTAAAQGATGAVQFSRGELVAARRHLAGLRGRFPRRSSAFPFDAAVWHLGILAMVHADLGEAQTARAIGAELLASATGGVPADLAYAHVLVAGVEAQLHNAPLVREHVETATRIGAEDAFPIVLASIGPLRGWALAAMGDPAAGIAVSSDGEAAWGASGQRLGQPFFAVLRAETYLHGNDEVAAAAAIAAGFEHADATGERRQDSELHRLRAECLRRAGRIDEAAAALDAALDIAAAQQARLAELRAAIDAVRLHRSTSVSAAARKRLAEVAAAFDADAHLTELSVAETLLRGDVTARPSNAA